MTPPQQYRFEIEGTAAAGQTWKTAGHIVVKHLRDALDAALRDTFENLTNGAAVFGQPGVGCRGPYNISRVELVRLVDDDLPVF